MTPPPNPLKQPAGTVWLRATAAPMFVFLPDPKFTYDQYINFVGDIIATSDTGKETVYHDCKLKPLPADERNPARIEVYNVSHVVTHMLADKA